ncbi:MAG: UbiA family prenyltransferase [Bacteroidia bacterium]|nr:UbiA family prenyltransferase [Bacteroidia bacterium]
MDAVIHTFKNYLSLIKFSHTIFALPFAVIGFFLGVVQPGFHLEWTLFLKVILCMVFARTSAMAFNRWTDRNLDLRNHRTRNREIPRGIISSGAALFLVLVSSAAFVITTWTINLLCFYLSPVALFVILAYSYTKRFTWLCHLFLGLGLSLAPIGAYLSVTGRFDWIPVFFSFTVLTWVSGFDIIYALQDTEFDREEKLSSIPVAFGKKQALTISSILHLFSVGFLIMAGIFAGFGWLYWTGVIIFSVMMIYQHTLVTPNDLSRVNMAFATTNGFASLLFATLVLTELAMH